MARPELAELYEYLATREQLPLLPNALQLLGEGAEVGVQEGRFSAHLLEHWGGARLYSVDPWLRQDPSEYRDVANLPQDRQDLHHRRTMARLARYRDRSSIWRMMSADASAKIHDSQLDFVYLDARHDYDAVREDLALWYPKVRPGGIVSGHDYLDGLLPQLGLFGVRTAVDEFFGALGLPVMATRDDAPFVSWLVRKPKE